MTMIVQEDSCITIDCPKCSLSLFLAHSHDFGDSPQQETSQNVLEEE